MSTKRKEKSTTTLRVDQIRRDSDTQARSTLDVDYVEELKLLVLEGHDLPPIDVIYDGRNHWISDGFHRLEAYLRADRPTIECNVMPGVKADAVWAACAANQSHGLRRTNADKERAVRLALSHQNAAGMSDNAIAQHCGVSPHLVAKHRKTAVRDYANAESTTRTGRDGRTIDTANIGRKPAARVVSDPDIDQTEDVAPDVPWEVNTEPEEPVYGDPAGLEEPVVEEPEPETPLMDAAADEGAEGNRPAGEDQANAELAAAGGEDEGPDMEPAKEAVPNVERPELQPEDAAVRQELTGMMRQLSGMRSRLEEVAGTRSGTFVEWLQLRKALDDAYHAVNFGRPYAVCPYCHGRRHGCKPCREAGFINETVYHSIPKELQVA